MIRIQSIWQSKPSLRRALAAGSATQAGRPHHNIIFIAIVVAVAVWLAGSSPLAFGKDSDSKPWGPSPKLYQATVDRAIQYLAAQQGEDGSLSPRIGIGPTAMATLALLRAGRGVADPQVAKGLKYLEQYEQESGGIHMPGGRIPTYETCIAVMCLKEANRDGRYDKVLKAADAFIRKGQIDETKGKDKSDVAYGGIGYGGRSRPDLSNTAFLVDALKSCGAEVERSGHSEGVGVRLSLPKPRKRVQHDEIRLEVQRRRILLHLRRRAEKPRRRARRRKPRPGRRRTAQLRLDDLQRLEEHDLRRFDQRRSAREGRAAMDPKKLRSEEQSRHGRRRAVLLLSHLRQSARRDGRR